MASWLSITDIVNEFGLQAQGADFEAVRDELKKVMSSIHPDKTGGNFSSEDDKSKFLRAQEALRFLELSSQASSAMIPVSQLPAVISALSQALASPSASNANALQSNYMPDARARISRRYTLPKIGSGVFAAVTGFLVAFSDKFDKHPLLGPLLNERTSQMFLLALMTYSGIFFLLSWYREKQSEANAEYLMSESALGHLFEMVTHKLTGSGEIRRISSRQIFEAVERISGYRHNSSFFALAFLGSRVDLQTIESAAAIQTQRLIERKVLTRVDVASIDAWYDVHH